MPQILLIEDNDGDAALIERALRSAGVTNPLYHVSNGADALAFLHTQQKTTGKNAHFIAFIDLRLPDMSGFEILKLMKDRPGFEKTLRVVISSIDNMESVKKAYNLGADSFITKPASQLDVQELIRSYPEHWRLIDAVALAPEFRPSASLNDPARNEVARLWAENCGVVQNVRDTLHLLHTAVHDNQETFTIIETLVQELRTNCAQLSEPNGTDPKHLLL